jgi:hypothetical protein
MGRGTRPLPQKRKPDGKKKRRGNRKGMCLEDRPLLESHAAAIDNWRREIFLAVPPDRDENPVSYRRSLTNGNVSGGRNRATSKSLSLAKHLLSTSCGTVSGQGLSDMR